MKKIPIRFGFVYSYLTMISNSLNDIDFEK